jgi:hypothetical protein
VLAFIFFSDAEVNLAPSHDNILMERICFILKIHRQIWMLRLSFDSFLVFTARSFLTDSFETKICYASRDRILSGVSSNNCVINLMKRLNSKFMHEVLLPSRSGLCFLHLVFLPDPFFELINLKELSAHCCVKMSAW